MPEIGEKNVVCFKWFKLCEKDFFPSNFGSWQKNQYLTCPTTFSPTNRSTTINLQALRMVLCLIAAIASAIFETSEAPGS